jgi:hypothetical protein
MPDPIRIAQARQWFFQRIAMNKEEGKLKEKQTERERITDQGQTFPPYPAPATGDGQKPAKSDAGKVEATDSLTATYWG